MDIETKSGILYLCATPIGNLEDITLRTLRILKEVDLIAAEDTRHSLKLLNHCGIKTPVTSYHEHNKMEKARYLVEQMLKGLSVALITDAGTPGISDPGEELVRQCYEAGVPLTALPGPAACITALITSGLETRRFCFEAFLPYDKKERERVLAKLGEETRTIVLYEAPHHLRKTLAELKQVLGAGRRLTVCRELTKRFEERLSLTLEEAVDYYGQNEPKGEFVLVIRGRNPRELEEEKQKEWETVSLEDHLRQYLDQGLSKKEAMKQMAKDRGVSKRDIYQRLIDGGI